MNQDGIIARLAALETLAGGCLTFLLASAGNDPGLTKTKAILDVLKAEADQGLSYLPLHIQAEAKTYLTDITNRILTNVTALRGMPAAKQ
jgi:hypothetical protein